MEKFTFFWSGPFSQWYPAQFIIEGKTFTCAEQYMMYKKAEFFGDKEIAEKIMQVNDPKTQKMLGRKVSGFNVDEWNKNAKAFVYMGNYHKFIQNPKLLEKLMETKGTTLVEASPYDTIWGIGLSEDNINIFNRDKWRGTNWLGEVLTSLRDDLLNDNN